MRKKRLFSSLSYIDEKFVKEAEPKMKVSAIASTKIITRVACLLLAAVLGLYLFIPFKKSGPDVTAYESSEYFPLIETIADYKFKPNPYKNNFQQLAAGVSGFFNSFSKNDFVGDAAPDMDAAPGAPEGGTNGSNGSYVEATDNQVEGVVEADIIKMTDKYIFRLGQNTLYVYSIDKEESEAVGCLTLPKLSDEYNSYKYNNNSEMYLSEDGKTVTVIKWYNDGNYRSKVGILSIDVSNVQDIRVKSEASVDGSYSSSRMVDGKLLLISEYYFRSDNVDYNDPETYVPTVTKNGEKSCFRFEDIIFPESITNTRYSVVSLFDEETLDVLGANALLNFNGAIYVSKNNVYVVRSYNERVDLSEEHTAYYTMAKSDIAVLSYSGQSLEKVGMLTVEGSIKDQYSMDEKDGYLRVVTSTRDYGFSSIKEENDQIVSIISEKSESASLTVFKLDGCERIAEVKDFAPEGEEAVSVRFDGDNAYVCTAVIVTFTDPVYFFDLSDYRNITYTDTGVIDGFSSSLIQLGDGFLLGIGEENWQYGKVEVYEQIDGEVKSVDKYLFSGEYSTEYKSYLVNREKDLFGFANTYYYNEQTMNRENRYVLLAFNGYELVEIVNVSIDEAFDPSRIRAVLIDDYLYITDDTWIKVVSIADQ